MLLKIKVQSIVDVITNSSTEVFVSCNDNTIKFVKKLLQEIIDKTHPGKNVDDVFEVKVYSLSAYVNWCSNIICDYNYYKKTNYQDNDTLSREDIDALYEEIKNEKGISSYEEYLQSSIKCCEACAETITIDTKDNEFKEEFKNIIESTIDIINSIGTTEVLC